MNIHDATEQAYKLGYEDGRNAAIPTLCKSCISSDNISCPENRVWCNTMGRYMKEDDYCSDGKRGAEDG